MAKLILKSIAYLPQATAGLPMSHKDLGVIDTDKPYKKLVIPAQNKHLYRLVDEQTGQVLKAQKLIRDHNDLKVYVGDVIVVELQDFYSFQNIASSKADQEPLYMVDAGEVSCVSGLIGPSEGINLPEMYVLWQPGMPVQTCLNPNAVSVVPLAGLAGISGLTTGGAIAATGAIGVTVIQASITHGTSVNLLPKLIGSVFAGPVIEQLAAGVKVSGLSLQAFDANGESLGVTDVKTDDSYELKLNRPNYQGALLLKVFQTKSDLTAQYLDEATQKPINFSTLLAVLNFQEINTQPVTANITELTNLAAVRAGATTTDSHATVPGVVEINDANQKVAQKFLGSTSLIDSPVIPTVNADGSSNLNNANTYGIALALLSQIKNVSDQSTADLANLLAPALTAPQQNTNAINYVNQASVNLINSGINANTLKTIVKALGNDLATGTVSLSSNASPALNLSTTAPDENTKLTAAVSNFKDTNKRASLPVCQIRALCALRAVSQAQVPRNSTGLLVTHN